MVNLTYDLKKLHKPTDVLTYPFPQEFKLIRTKMWEFINYNKNKNNYICGITSNQLDLPYEYRPDLIIAKVGYNDDGTPIYKEFFNLSIKRFGRTVFKKEICLNLPNIEVEVPRKLNLRITYYTLDDTYNPIYNVETIYGGKTTLSFRLQHLYDHSMGVLINDT